MTNIKIDFLFKYFIFYKKKKNDLVLNLRLFSKKTNILVEISLDK
jgi:hypothetical protein